MINNKILIIAIVGILLVSVFSYMVKGQTTGSAVGYLILMDQKVSTSDYDALKNKSFNSIVYLPSSNCQGYTTACAFVFPEGVNSKADINSDGKIDMTDVNTIVKAYGCNNLQSCWNSPVEECFFTISGRKFKDPTRDCIMDASDVALVTNNYVKSDPYALSPACDNYNECKADVNQDGIVNIYDVAIVSSKVGSTADDFERLLGRQSQADLNNDGKIDILDVVIVTGNFGKSAEQKCESTPVEHVSGNQWRISASGKGLYYVGASYLCSL